jgi:hypothetical protein
MDSRDTYKVGNDRPIGRQQVSTWPISPLSDRDLTFAVVNYDFTSLTANELSSLPNLETAIDTALADFGTSVADQTALIASMAGDLDDLGNILNELSTDDFDQVLADLAGAASAADGMLNDFNVLVG